MPTRPKTHLQDLRQRGKAPTRQAADAAYDARRKRDPKLSTAKAIRDSGQWKKTRARFKRMYPLCCDPLALHPDRPEVTAAAHHIIGAGARPDLAFINSNLAPLCTGCHARIEGMERAGKATAHLFANWKRNNPERMPRIG